MRIAMISILAFIVGVILGIIIMSVLTAGKIAELEIEIMYLREIIEEHKRKNFNKLNIIRRDSHDDNA